MPPRCIKKRRLRDHRRSTPPWKPAWKRQHYSPSGAAAVALVCLASLLRSRGPRQRADPPHGRFPRPGDPFRLVPCTNATLPPALDDPDPERTWAGRDHWALRARQHRREAPDARAQLAFVDAFNDAVWAACRRRLGDLARFVSTASVARDLERIREALGEDELTGYLVSYGTGIGQTYAAMFPGRVGRVVLDGTEYVRDHRRLGGFGWTALGNITDAWRDGFLGECVAAGPAHCALAGPVKAGPAEAGPESRPTPGPGPGLAPAAAPPTVDGLDARIGALLSAVAARPVPGYTAAAGPSLVTYSALVGAIYGALYNARSWPALARMLAELEAGNATLRHPVLLIAETHDPATPLRNGRRLLAEMGPNARLVVHHGYGHSSRDTSRCTDAIARAYILQGVLPDAPETACYADEKPYQYGVKGQGLGPARDPLELWDEHLAELAMLNPRLLPRS